jgi:hypothetical protein
LALFDVTFTHAPLQSRVPAGHSQRPDVHTPPGMQTTPQPPQLLRSVERSTQTPLHATSPDAQQIPLEQTFPAPHEASAEGPSTTPLQSSSMPLHVSLDGARITTSIGHAASVPVQLSAGSQ